jgi:isoleucyl-tRNA synthetase
LSEFNGDQIESLKYEHPVYKRSSPIILADYVSNEDGTGLVHNAPGFGSDDYYACKKYKIEPFAPIDNFGKFTNEVNDAELTGIFYENANEIVIKQLQAVNAILHNEIFTHSAAHD